jgi:phosphonate transport system substrate-binding protein
VPTLLLSPLARARHRPADLELVEQSLQSLGLQVRVVEAADHDSFDHDVSHATIAMGWVPPVLIARVEPTAKAILTAVRHGRSGYRSALVGRKSDGLTLATLLGRRAVWIDAHSTAGYLLPSMFLRLVGLDPPKLLGEQRFAGNYRDALRQVAEGRSDFTAVYTLRSDDASVTEKMTELVGPEVAEQLAPFAFTAEVPGDALVITSQVDAPLAESWVSKLTGLGADHPLLKMFGAEKLVRARDGDYRYVRTLGLTKSLER